MEEVAKERNKIEVEETRWNGRNGRGSKRKEQKLRGGNPVEWDKWKRKQKKITKLQ